MGQDSATLKTIAFLLFMILAMMIFGCKKEIAPSEPVPYKYHKLDKYKFYQCKQ